MRPRQECGMAEPRVRSRLILFSVLVAAAFVAVAIFIGTRGGPSKLTADEARELIHVKNVGLGQLENQKINEALESFDPMVRRLPGDPLPARNIAAGRVVALGEEGAD